MLRANKASSHSTEAESSNQPTNKSRAKGRRDNTKPRMIRDHNHANPEDVWGDEGPVNEPRQTS